MQAPRHTRSVADASPAPLQLPTALRSTDVRLPTERHGSECCAEVSAPLRERFLAENGRQNSEAGFAWDEDQEEAEWKRVLQEARTQNTFLRPVHVLAMACVLKRPIIMYSDTVTRDAFNVPIAPVPFFGIYLPFLVKPEDCSKQPLVLVFDAAHFMPLVASARMDGGTVHVPLVDKEYEPLPLRFRLSDDECAGEKRAQLLSSYMNVTTIPKGSHDWEKEFPCAHLEREGANELVEKMLEQFVAAAEHQFTVVGPDEDGGGGASRGGSGGSTMSPRSQSEADRLLAQQLGQEATATNAHSDQLMAERLQAEAFGGAGAANNAQSDADAALARQLQAELNPGTQQPAASGNSSANSAAATDALVFRFKVTMEHVAKAGQVTTVNSPEFGALIQAPKPTSATVAQYMCSRDGVDKGAVLMLSYRRCPVSATGDHHAWA